MKSTASRKSHSYYEGSGKGASFSDPSGSWRDGGPTGDSEKPNAPAKGQGRKKDVHAKAGSGATAVRRGRFE